MKKLTFIFSLLLVFTTLAQKKELTLSDAVLQQYRNFAPNQIRYFQWIPNTDCYVYIDKGTNLMKASAGNTDAKSILSITEFNSSLGADMKGFYNLEFKNENEFYLSDGANFYSYNTVTKSGKKLYELTENAENGLLHPKTGNTAFTKENNVYLTTEKGEIAITSIQDKNIVSGQAIARSEFGITGGLFWSPNGKILAFYQKDESKVADYPLLDNNTYPGKLISIKYPMAGQDSERAKVGLYNLESKKLNYFSARNGEENYLSNLSFTPDEKFVLVAEVNRDQNHMWLNLFNAETGEFVKTLFEETNDKWVEPEHPAFFPSETSNNFVWISEKDGFNNLYYYDLNGKLIKQLTANKFVTKDIVSADKKGENIYFYATGQSPLNTMLYKVSIGGNQELVTQIEGTHSCSLSGDGNYIYDTYSNHSVPSVNQILTNKGKEIKVLMKGNTSLNEYKIGETEIGKLKGNDGSDLYYRIIKPSNFDPSKKYPVLVYVYGGPHAQLITNSWLDGSSLWMHWMAEQGYIIFTVDNRGSGERGFAFESQIHRQLGTLEMEDQLTGVAFLKTLPYVNPDKLAVHGWSYGGFMTTSLMLRKPGTFNVGVAGGPVTDWKYYEIMYGERYMDRPQQNPEGYKNNSLMEYVNNLQGDLLLIHGTVDDVVVMQHNLALVQKFIENGVQMDFFPYPMHKHNVSGKDRVHLIEKILTYIIEKN